MAVLTYVMACGLTIGSSEADFSSDKLAELLSSTVFFEHRPSLMCVMSDLAVLSTINGRMYCIILVDFIQSNLRVYHLPTYEVGVVNFGPGGLFVD